MANFNWQKLLNKSWTYTKVFFAVLTLMVGSYFYGTYYPNKSAIAEVNAELDVFYMNKIKEMDLQEPEFTYINDTQFIRAMHKCINYINFKTPKHLRVPYEMIIGQAALESGWGTSRFAKEANNLFGIRTYNLQEPHMLPSNNPKKWGVKVFEHECDSVLNYMSILNNGGAYKKYRDLRESGIDDPYILVETLDSYAADKHYFSKIKSILKKIRSEYDT